MTKHDVVYIVGPGNDQQDELRLSLRSVAQNFPHRHVWIVGHKPSWVRNVRHIPTLQTSRVKYVNALYNIMQACKHSDVSDTFVLFNDDFYANNPVPVPHFHRGTIQHMLNGAHRRQGNSDYLWGMRKADAHLREQGISDPLSYELHMPMPIHGDTFADIMGRYDPDDHMAGVAKRSIYGNLAGVGGQQMDDVRPARHGYWHWAWLSTNDDSGRPGKRLRVYLEHRFPNPCTYEQRETAPVTRTLAWVNEQTGAIQLGRPGTPDTRDKDKSPAWFRV